MSADKPRIIVDEQLDFNPSTALTVQVDAEAIRKMSESVEQLLTDGVLIRLPLPEDPIDWRRIIRMKEGK